MNSAMTAGLHHRWRARAVDLAQRRSGRPRARRGDRHRRPGDRAGAARVARRGGASAATSPRACSTARVKARAGWRGAGTGARRELRFEWADALELPYADDAFDAATVGLRRAQLRRPARAGLAEMARVVRPGGRVVVLEMTTPTRPPLSLFYRAVVRPRRAVARAARRRARQVAPRPRGEDRRDGIADAYTYLPNSVKRFPAPAAAGRGDGARAGCARSATCCIAGGHHRDPRPAPLPRRGHDESDGGTAARRRTAAVSAADVDAVEAIMRRGGAGLRERMVRTELHLERVTAEAGAPLASHATATVAGGRQAAAPAAGRARRRVRRVDRGDDGRGRGAASCARPWRSSWCTRRRSCTTIVIDGAQLRRGHPTVAAARRPRRSRSRPATCCSRARSPSSRATARRPSCALCRDASSALAEGELLQREDAYALARRGRALSAALRAEDRRAVRGRLPPRRAGGRRRLAELADALGAFARRIGLAFQLLDDVLDVSGPVERTGKARGTDLLDGTVTLPFILARERDRKLADVRPLDASRTRAGRAAVRADRRDGRARGGARTGAGARRQRPRRRCPASCRTAATRRCSTSSPTRWSSATAEFTYVVRHAPCVQLAQRPPRGAVSEVAGSDQVGVERAHEELDFVGHVRVREAL